MSSFVASLIPNFNLLPNISATSNNDCQSRQLAVQQLYNSTHEICNQRLFSSATMEQLESLLDPTKQLQPKEFNSSTCLTGLFGSNPIALLLNQVPIEIQASEKEKLIVEGTQKFVSNEYNHYSHPERIFKFKSEFNEFQIFNLFQTSEEDDDHSLHNLKAYHSDIFHGSATTQTPLHIDATPGLGVITNDEGCKLFLFAPSNELTTAESNNVTIIDGLFSKNEQENVHKNPMNIDVFLKHAKSYCWCILRPNQCLYWPATSFHAVLNITNTTFLSHTYVPADLSSFNMWLKHSAQFLLRDPTEQLGTLQRIIVDSLKLMPLNPTQIQLFENILNYFVRTKQIPFTVISLKESCWQPYLQLEEWEFSHNRSESDDFSLFVPLSFIAADFAELSNFSMKLVQNNALSITDHTIDMINSEERPLNMQQFSDSVNYFNSLNPQFAELFKQTVTKCEQFLAAGVLYPYLASLKLIAILQLMGATEKKNSNIFKQLLHAQYRVLYNFFSRSIPLSLEFKDFLTWILDKETGATEWLNKIKVQLYVASVFLCDPEAFNTVLICMGHKFRLEVFAQRQYCRRSHLGRAVLSQAFRFIKRDYDAVQQMEVETDTFGGNMQLCSLPHIHACLEAAYAQSNEIKKTKELNNTSKEISDKEKNDLSNLATQTNTINLAASSDDLEKELELEEVLSASNNNMNIAESENSPAEDVDMKDASAEDESIYSNTNSNIESSNETVVSSRLTRSKRQRVRSDTESDIGSIDSESTKNSCSSKRPTSRGSAFKPVKSKLFNSEISVAIDRTYITLTKADLQSLMWQLHEQEVTFESFDFDKPVRKVEDIVRGDSSLNAVKKILDEYKNKYGTFLIEAKTKEFNYNNKKQHDEFNEWMLNAENKEQLLLLRPNKNINPEYWEATDAVAQEVYTHARSTIDKNKFVKKGAEPVGYFNCTPDVPVIKNIHRLIYDVQDTFLPDNKGKSIDVGKNEWTENENMPCYYTDIELPEETIYNLIQPILGPWCTVGGLLKYDSPTWNDLYDEDSTTDKFLLNYEKAKTKAIKLKTPGVHNWTGYYNSISIEEYSKPIDERNYHFSWAEWHDEMNGAKSINIYLANKRFRDKEIHHVITEYDSLAIPILNNPNNDDPNDDSINVWFSVIDEPENMKKAAVIYHDYTGKKMDFYAGGFTFNFSPELFLRHGVKLYYCIQRIGDIVFTNGNHCVISAPGKLAIANNVSSWTDKLKAQLADNSLPNKLVVLNPTVLYKDYINNKNKHSNRQLWRPQGCLGAFYDTGIILIKALESNDLSLQNISQRKSLENLIEHILQLDSKHWAEKSSIAEQMKAKIRHV